MRVSDQERIAPKTAARLPRGPHALPQEIVSAHQRERLLDAAVDGMAERGYAGLTVRDLIARAGVSRRTFYEIFEDKLECVLAAHERAFERLSEVIVGACRSEGDWPRRAVNAVGDSLDFAASSPREARLVVASCHPGADGKIANWGRGAHRKLAAVLRGGRELAAKRELTLELTEQAVIGAVMAIIGDRLVSDEGAGVTELKGELVEIILTPYVGAAGAHRAAISA